MRLIDPIELKRAISVAAMSNNHKTLEQIIDEQPTIEHKTGKWLETDSHEPCWYKCDQCGRLYDLPDKYCPECGAKMEGITWLNGGTT